MSESFLKRLLKASLGMIKGLRTTISAADHRLLPFKREQDPAKAGWFSIDKLKDALPHAERARIASNVRVIQELHTHLNAAGWLEFDTLADGLAPMHLLYTRQVMLDVPDLSSAIRSAKRLKNEGDM